MNKGYAVLNIRDGNIIASKSVGTSGGGTATVTWSVLPNDEICLRSRPTSTYQPGVIIYLRVGYDYDIDTSPDNSRVLRTVCKIDYLQRPQNILNPGINLNRGAWHFCWAGAIQGLCCKMEVCIIPVWGEIGLVIK